MCSSVVIVCKFNYNYSWNTRGMNVILHISGLYFGMFWHDRKKLHCDKQMVNFTKHRTQHEVSVSTIAIAWRVWGARPVSRSVRVEISMNGRTTNGICLVRILPLLPEYIIIYFAFNFYCFTFDHRHTHLCAADTMTHRFWILAFAYMDHDSNSLL